MSRTSTRSSTASLARRGRALPALLVLATAQVACLTYAPETATRADPVVYGDDDRREAYDHPSAALREVAQRAAVALMHASDVDLSDPANVRLPARTLAEAQQLCDGERFADQPTAAFCSGTLIADDLVLTAGHCVRSAADCADARFVFNYHLVAPGTLQTITADDVFACAQLVAQRLDPAGSQPLLDYAVVRLDRRATPRFAAVTVRTDDAPLPAGRAIAIVGFGSGLPAKLDSGGVVRDPRAAAGDFFVGTTDSFGGNSGSGVYDLERGDLVGALVRGDTDYVEQGACRVVNRCAADACRGEDVTYVRHALAAACAAGAGASFCRARGAPPASWTCDPAWYAAGDDCDCACGARDPDCDNAALRTLNCAAGQTCGADGRCVTPGGTPPPATNPPPRAGGTCAARPTAARAPGAGGLAALTLAALGVALAARARRRAPR